MTDAVDGEREAPVAHRSRHAANPDSGGPAGGPRGAGGGSARAARARGPSHHISRAGIAVLCVVIPVALAGFIGMALTWPPSVAGAAANSGLVATGVQYYAATVTRAEMTTCDGTQEDALPDGTVPATVPCLRIEAKVTQGPSTGTTATVYPTVGVSLGDVRVGTGVILQYYPAADGVAAVWAFSDVQRTVPLSTLALAFVLVTALVAGWRGIRAIVGLAVAFVVLWSYVIPGLVAGRNAMVLTLCAAVAIMTVVGYVTHGFSLRTSTALLGTFAGLALVAGVGALGVWATRLNPITSEDDYQVAQV
ncbi:MAG: YibE/F family protein, partial [Micrococcales bacterium]|nr:YibE/F family protein [Micrococcales bacterium]